METMGQARETTSQSLVCIFSVVQEDDYSGEEEEEEEEIYFSAQDLCQIRNAIFNLLKNFLRLLPKFSLKEKPQCIQTCIEVSENPQDLWLTTKKCSNSSYY